MTENTVIDFTKPSDFSSDPPTDVLRQGARDLLATAVQAEVTAFIAGHAHLLDEVGRHRLVRHGFLPEREVMTGIGKVPVQVPRVRDRGTAKGAEKIRFRSALIPPYLRKSKSVEDCCHGFTSRASPRATSPRRWRRFWGRMPRGCPRQRSPG